MWGRRIGIGCGIWLVAIATTAPAQLPPSVAPTNAPPAAPPSPVAAPFDGAVAPATFNQSVNPAVPTQPAREPHLLPSPEARQASKLPPLKSAAGDSASRPSGGGASMSTVLFALAVVLGLFLGLAALLRRGMPQQARTLPPEAVELLGRIALPGRRQGHLIRVGNKITLVSFANNETRPLVEITDPQEIDRLAGLCKQADPTSATRSFRSVVDGFFRETKTNKEAVDD